MQSNSRLVSLLAFSKQSGLILGGLVLMDPASHIVLQNRYAEKCTSVHDGSYGTADR